METKEEILSILKRAGMKITRQRESILAIFLQTDARLTADDIFLRLRERGEDFGLSTVYRTLSALVEHQVLERAELPDNVSQCFNLAHKGHRHQLTCIQCKRTILLDECPAEDFLESIGRKHGFQVTGHSFEVFGVCPNCQRLQREQGDSLC